MKAIYATEYGSPDVLSLQEVPTPSPEADEVLIKVHAASVNAGDWHLMRGEPKIMRMMFGIRKPKVNVLGTDVAGTIEAVGSEVTDFTKGDAVYGDASGSGFGTFAEYVCVKQKTVALKPESMSFDEAATVPSASVTALQAVRDKGKVQPGQKVLVNGASGGVGSFAIQIAKALGAEVTGVCSTRNVEMVRSLGADHVIDYTQEDFAENGPLYDVLIDVAAYRSVSTHMRALKPDGIYVMVGGSGGAILQTFALAPWKAVTGGPKPAPYLVSPNREDLEYMRGLIESGQVAPVIDRSYPLAETPEAVRYVETLRARGKVVIHVASNGAA